MKKVLIITYYWPPSGGAGVQRWLKFVKYMVQMDVQPYVLTVDPNDANYPHTDESLQYDIPAQVKTFTAGSFNIYQFYKKFSSNKNVPHGGFANTEKLDFKEKVMRFIRGNFFLPDPRRSWNKSAYKKALQIMDEHRINTVITTSPPHSTQLIGLNLKMNRGIHWIADLRDPWTNIFYYKELYPTFIANAIQKRYEKKVLQYADHVVTVSKSLKDLFQQKIEIHSDKISVIPNGFDKDDFINFKKEQSDKFVISYIGTLSNEYPLNTFINSLQQLTYEERENLVLHFVGSVDGNAILQLKDAGFSSNLELINYVEHKKAIEYMVNSDLLLLVIPQTENNEGIVTGKLFEYMASGTPILLIGPKNGDAAKIIKETQTGEVFGYNDSKAIQNYLQNAVAESPKRRKELSEEVLQYSRAHLTEKLIEKCF